MGLEPANTSLAGKRPDEKSYYLKGEEEDVGWERERGWRTEGDEKQ